MLLRKVREASKSDQSSLSGKAQEFDFPSDSVWCSIYRCPSLSVHLHYHFLHLKSSSCTPNPLFSFSFNLASQLFSFSRNGFCLFFIFHYCTMVISRLSLYQCQNFQTHYDSISKPDISEQTFYRAPFEYGEEHLMATRLLQNVPRQGTLSILIIPAWLDYTSILIKQLNCD
jgi:hypothetical protein